MPALALDDVTADSVGAAADDLRELARTMPFVEDAAQAAARYLYDNVRDGEGRRACALVRIYKTHPYAKLPPDLQEFARGALGEEPDPAVRCLTLLGTAGDEPAWNSRQDSVGHRAIPLPTEDFVLRLPMVAQLITQLGLEIGDVIAEPKDTRLLAYQSYDVFHVPDARGSDFIPAQDFVEEHAIRSALGFGGVLLSGHFYAAVLFSRTEIDINTARTLKILALPLRVALAAMVGRPVFSAS
jgi:hypothetical protein